MKKQEYEWEKEIIKLKDDHDKKKHILHMKELEFIRESDRLKHEKKLEYGRIKTAEIRKSQERQRVWR
ncbi:MAG: hypothetical protein IH845_05350 [Nanoarchaeota archaeon]|nr:hypothetical protein [Nanoarchaeota archaeon]